MIPGINVLNIALGVLGKQKVQHLRATGRTQSDLGNWVTTYADPVELLVSWQPLDAKKYEQLGLDLAKEYFSVWVRTAVVGIKRGKSPDRFIYRDRLHEVVDVKDWHSQDGWCQVVVVDIGEAE